MFNTNKKQVFSFRKFKGYGLASAVIAAFFFATSVSADVVDNGNGTTTLSNDKASTVVETSKFKDNTDKTASEIFAENGYEPETVTTGKESVTNDVNTTVSYETEDGTKIKNDVTHETSTTTDLDYKITGKSGKEYTGETSKTEADAGVERHNYIEQDGKKYEYIRTETTSNEDTHLTNTNFNDVTTKASVEGMHNQDGSIKYDKIKTGSRVWVLEELQDGSYGKYTLIENAQNLNDNTIKEAAKTATTKFSKAEVEAKGGFKENDSIVVYETNTYATHSPITTTKTGHEFNYFVTNTGYTAQRSIIDDIYSTGLLPELTKTDNTYFYKGKPIYTTEDMVNGKYPELKYEVYNKEKGLIGISRVDFKQGDYKKKDDYTYTDLNGYLYTPFTYKQALFDFLSKTDSTVDTLIKKWTTIEGVGRISLSQALLYDDDQYESTIEEGALLYNWLNENIIKKYNITGERANGFVDHNSTANADRPTSTETITFESKYKNKPNDDINYDHYNEFMKEALDELKGAFTEEHANQLNVLYARLHGKSLTDLDKPIKSYEDFKNKFINALGQEGIGVGEYYDGLTDIKKYHEANGASPILTGLYPEYKFTGNSAKSFDGFLKAHRNSPGLITKTNETFTYHDEITPLRAYRLSANNNLVKHIYKEMTKGSVVVTYKDTDGNDLAPQETVKDNAYDGEDYTTSPKQIDPKTIVETTSDGLTRTVTITYEQISTPANANGSVIGDQTITVPYEYRAIYTTQTNGSVIATYKDEDGQTLAESENVITNKPESTNYQTTTKEIPSSQTVETDSTGRTITTTSYTLVKTPENDKGQVLGDTITEVPYVYRKTTTTQFIPNNTPQVEPTELKVTRYTLADGTEVKTAEEGFQSAPKLIDNYQFTGNTQTDESGSIQTHIYELIQSEIPKETPEVDVPTLKVTRYTLEDGTEIKNASEGFNPAPSTIDNKYQFTGNTTTSEDSSIQTHIYQAIVNEVPKDAPQIETPELKVTRHVDENGTELLPTEEGFTEARKMIGNFQYSGKSTTENSIQTHVYTQIQHNVPSDAPTVEIPELKITRYTNEDGEEIKDVENGFVDAQKFITKDKFKYEFTGKTTLSEGIQTHIYKLIDTQDPSILDYHSKVPSTPKPSESNKSEKSTITVSTENKPEQKVVSDEKAQTVDNQINTPENVKNELPKTGESHNNFAIIGISILTALGLIGFLRNRKEN